MKFPKEFYYEKTFHGLQFSKKPTGRHFNLTNYLAGEPCWGSSAFPRKEIRKKIVITDWTIRNWSFAKQEKVIARCTELLQADFSLYIYTDNQCLPLNLENINSLKENDFRAVPPISAQQFLKEHPQFSPTETYFFDDINLSDFLWGYKSNQRHLLISDLCTFNANERIKLFALLKNATPPVEWLVIDKFPMVFNDLIEEVKQHFPDIQIRREYKILTQLPTAEAVKFWKGKESYVCGTHLYRGNLQDITRLSIDFGNRISINQLQLFLNAAESLQELRLNDKVSAVNGTQLNLDNGSLNDLQSITITKSFPLYDFFHLLTVTSSLKNLTVGIPLLSKNITLERVTHFIDSLRNLQQLETLSIDLFDDDHIKILKHFIKAAPNLKQITVSYLRSEPKEGFKALLAIFPDEWESMTKIDAKFDRTEITGKELTITYKRNHSSNDESSILEELKLTKTDFNSDFISSTINRARKLKQLSIYYPKNQLNRLELKPNNLPKLASVYLTPDTINACLGSLINAAPFIREITFGNFDNIKPEKIEQFKTLSHLVSVYIALTPLLLEDLEIFLNQNLHIKRLVFLHYSPVYSGIKIEENSLIALKELNFFGSEINHTDLFSFLAAAPHIEELFLESTRINRETKDLSIKQIKVDRLTQIILRECEIVIDDLANLLQAAPNIETLSLEDSLIVEENDFVLEANSLPFLSQLILRNSNIRANDLKALLRAAPNITTLDIKSCSIQKDEELADLLAKIPVIKGKKCFLANKADTRNKNYHQSSYQPSVIPAIPEHDPKKFKKYTPPEEKPFEFTHEKESQLFNQAMIIAKFSRYLQLMNEGEYLIPKIQKGICNGLSHLFHSLTLIEWKTLITELYQWNGEKDTLSKSLCSYFKLIRLCIEEFQLSPPESKNYFIGDNLEQFLLSLPSEVKLILQNPWHAIAIKKNQHNWDVYDPNSASNNYSFSQQTAIKLIKSSLGKLIMVKNHNINNPPISNIAQFIEEGGLFMLFADNYSDILLALQQQNPSLAALEGLFMCDTSGKPAWAMVITHHDQQVKDYVYSLLKQYKTAYSNALTILGASLKNHSELERSHLLEKIVQKNTVCPDSFYDELIEAIRNPPNILLESYEQRLITWQIQQQQEQSVSLESYCQKCVSQELPKRLIKFDGSEAKKGFLWSLEKHCLSIKRPYFVAKSPEDLSCFSSFVTYDATTNSGKIKQGFGGPLHDFLQQNSHKSPLLIIDYDKFLLEDFARFNTLLDNKRSIDREELSEDVLIVGLIDTSKPDCYQGSDFYSRISDEPCPVKNKQLKAEIPDLIPKKAKQEDSYPINLYMSADWESQLIGNWLLNGSQLIYQEGKLADALKQPKIIEIQNAPWDNEAFVEFWRRFLLQQTINLPNGSLNLSKNIQFTRNDHYDWPNLLTRTTFSPSTAIIADKSLNPGNYDDFLGRYELGPDKTLIMIPGYFEQAQGQTLEINLTRSLSEHQWARLLDECNTHQVKLKLHCAPEVTLPPTFRKVVASELN